MPSTKLFLSLLVAYSFFEACDSVQQDGLSCASASGVFRSKVYTFHPEWTTVAGAIQRCALNSRAVLASVADKQEKEFVLNLIGKAKYTGSWVWVGGLYQYPNFVWMESGQPIAASAWAPGSPTKANKDLQCTALIRENTTVPFRLSDWWCHHDDGNDDMAPYICAR